MSAKFIKLDHYIEGTRLSTSEMIYLYLDTVLTFAYECSHIKTIDEAKELMGAIKEDLGRFSRISEVFYILNKTSLSWWQKLKLKIQYIFYS